MANKFITVFESPSPEDIYCYSPGICILDSGRIVATMDIGGPGVVALDGEKYIRGTSGASNQCRVFTSDDDGDTWIYRASFPMMHARPFVAGEKVYVIGHRGDIAISCSEDNGDSWGDTVSLSKGEHWHGAPCNVAYADGRIYLAMEINTQPDFVYWPVSKLAPVVLSAKLSDDLCDRESWSFSDIHSFDQMVEIPELFGMPFYKTGQTAPGQCVDGRGMYPSGWLETNIVQIVDPDNLLYDPEGKTFHLFLRLHTGATNTACMLKAEEDEDGNIKVGFEKAPSGRDMLFVPFPGGHNKFHIVYDEVTKLYWMCSSLSRDSMTSPEKLSSERFNLPNNERDKLALYFSKNCIDWCMAGLICKGDSPKESRNYASLAIKGDNLLVLSRSGDSRAKSAHNGNLITFHKIKNFRNLVY
ncbi:MAG: sialidase family protein [Sedimentisphaeraceae bacterium JB056]